LAAMGGRDGRPPSSTAPRPTTREMDLVVCHVVYLRGVSPAMCTCSPYCLRSEF
jgi:hypothetical protein